MSMKPARPSMLHLLLITAAAVFLTSGCGMFSKDDDDVEYVSAQATREPPGPGTWVQVQSNPPTYFPRGVSADHPTDAFSGEWVQDGASDTRYFVPKGGASGYTKRELTESALSMTNRGSRIGGVIDKVTPDFGKKDS